LKEGFSMRTYTLEKIKEEHLADVLLIYNHYVLNSTATFHAEALTTAEMCELVFFAYPRYQAYVILAGSECCGYAYIGPHKSRAAYNATGEVSVYLKPGYEGKGLGRLALRQIEQHAREHGFHVLVATICSQNVTSLRLFLQLGFEQCAHYKEVGRKFDQWLDVTACQKILR
jgi:phosphinothricin acetyltransferase